MSKEKMLDLIRRIKDDVELQSSDTKFELSDLIILAEYEYKWMVGVNERMQKK